MTFRSVAPVLLVLALAVATAVAQPTNLATPFRLIDGHGNMMADSLEELDDEIMMESESARRVLAGQSGYISYGALGRNRVPCNQRGQSYYNCNSHQKANPYTRGCTRATLCARSNR